MAELGTVQDTEPTAEGIRVWNGEENAELVDRSDKRQRILNEAGVKRQRILDEAGVDDEDELMTQQRQQFYRTMAYTHSVEHMGRGKVGRLSMIRP